MKNLLLFIVLFLTSFLAYSNPCPNRICRPGRGGGITPKVDSHVPEASGVEEEIQEEEIQQEGICWWKVIGVSCEDEGQQTENRTGESVSLCDIIDEEFNYADKELQQILSEQGLNTPLNCPDVKRRKYMVNNFPELFLKMK